MKKFFTLLFIASTATFVIANANSTKDIHRPKSTRINHSNAFIHHKGGGSASNDIYVALAAKIPADSPFAPIAGSSVHIAFDSSFDSNVYGPEDAQDFNSGFGGFGGAGNNAFAIPQGSLFLSIEGRQLPTVNDTISFTFQNPTVSNYQLQIDASSFKANGLNAYLYDNFLKKSTLLPDTLSRYNFSVDAFNNATFMNRFSIVFKTSALSINSISLSSILNENAVTLNWKTVGESNLASYIIQKSVDGVRYTSLGTIAAKNVFAATYSFVDANVSVGNSYYRIKTTDKNGRVSYSTISSITKGDLGIGFGVYPNPIKNKIVNVKFSQIVKGNFIVRIYTSLGKLVSTKSIQHNGGTATYSTPIDAAIKSGLYKLTLYTTGSNAVYTTNILVNN